MPIGRNGTDSTGRLFMGPYPVLLVKNTSLRWRCRMPVRIWPRCGSFLNGRRKRCGRSGSCVRGVSVRVFYLFYLRLVLLPHQLVRGRASGKWWAEQDETNSQDQTGIPVRSCLFTSQLLLIISVHISAWCILQRYRNHHKWIFRWFPANPIPAVSFLYFRQQWLSQATLAVPIKCGHQTDLHRTKGKQWFLPLSKARYGV